MKLYLSSYKLGTKIDELKNWITENNNKIGIIDNAKDGFSDRVRSQQGTLKDIIQLEEIGFKVTQLNLKDYFGKPIELRSFLKDFQAFYVVGGNTFILRKAMKLSGFDEYLKKVSQNPNYLYAGYSAGVCVLCENMEAIAIMDEPEVNPYDNSTPLYSGIGLLNYALIPHYESDHPETELANQAVSFCRQNKIPYKTLKDGDVIIEYLN